MVNANSLGTGDFSDLKLSDDPQSERSRCSRLNVRAFVEGLLFVLGHTILRPVVTASWRLHLTAL